MNSSIAGPIFSSSKGESLPEAARASPFQKNIQLGFAEFEFSETNALADEPAKFLEQLSVGVGRCCQADRRVAGF
jgi:hypothetical protein